MQSTVEVKHWASCNPKRIHRFHVGSNCSVAVRGHVQNSSRINMYMSHVFSFPYLESCVLLWLWWTALLFPVQSVGLLEGGASGLKRFLVYDGPELQKQLYNQNHNRTLDKNNWKENSWLIKLQQNIRTRRKMITNECLVRYSVCCCLLPVIMICEFFVCLFVFWKAVGFSFLLYFVEIHIKKYVFFCLFL